MAWRTANLAACVAFNSGVTNRLRENYRGFVQDKIIKEKSEPSSKTFAPSSFRCERKSWFRLRGVQPDVLKSPDVGLEYKAEVGTARHLVIQSNLRDMLGDDWVPVSEYLQSNPIPYEYELEVADSGLETKVAIMNPPIHFACDGILRIDGKIYLLEIKTCERSSFDELTDPKPGHLDQIKCYCALLGIQDIIFIYEDRLYGDMKFYEYHVSLSDMQAVIKKMEYIMQMADANLAPDRLDRSDYMCSNCEYKSKCTEWG